MPIWDRWIEASLRRLGYVKGITPISVALGGGSTGSLLGDDSMPSAAQERRALACSWIYSDIQFIANECSQAVLRVYAGDEEIVDHPLAALLQRPNPFMSEAFIWQYLVVWLLLRGEAYWWLVPDQAGGLAQIWPVPSDNMAPLPDPDKYIAGYEYTSPMSGIPTRLDVSQVAFFRRPNPFDLHRGLGLFQAFRLAAETDLAAAQWNRDTFRNEATVRTVIALPETLSQPAYEAAKATILNELTELHRRYMITRAGQVDVKAIGVSPKDAEYLASRTFNREEIDRVFGIPAGLWAKEATRANADAAWAVARSTAVWPLLNLVADTITTQVLKPYYGDDFEARFDDIRMEDRELLLRERQAYWQVQTVNEAREDLGLPPLRGELYDTVPISLISSMARTADTAGLLAATSGGTGEEKPPAPPRPEERTEEEEGVELPPEGKADLRRWRSVALRRLRSGESPAYDFESSHIPARLKTAILGRLRVAKDEESVKAAFDPQSALKAEPPRPSNESALRRRIAEVLAARGDAVAKKPDQADAALAGLDDELRAAIVPELVEAVREAMLDELESLGVVQFDEAELNEAAIEWANQYSYSLIRGITDTTRQQVQTAIRTFLETPGMTQGDLRRLLEPTFGAARAEAIATTEVTRAISQATNINQQLLAEAGIQMERIWNTSNDEIVCLTCGPLDGKSEDAWRDNFPDGPPAHPNCRCWSTLRVVRKR